MPRGRRSTSRFSTLIQEHSPFHSISDLGRAIGEPGLDGKIRTARKAHQIPKGDIYDKIADQLDPVGVSLLLTVLARDARMRGYTDDEAVWVKIEAAIRGLDERNRRILIDLLHLDDVRPDDW